MEQTIRLSFQEIQRSY